MLIIYFLVAVVSMVMLFTFTLKNFPPGSMYGKNYLRLERNHGMGSGIRLVRVAVSACRNTPVLKGFEIRLIPRLFCLRMVSPFQLILSVVVSIVIGKRKTRIVRG